MPLRFVNPNLHVILIHYPLGVFVLGVFLELFSFLWKRSSIRVAARWMIVIGALLSLPSATSGIYALYDVKTNQGLDDARYHMLRLHVIFMGIASILAVSCAVTALGTSDAWRKKLYLPLLGGVVIAWGLMVVGAWNGGETIYQHGTAVAPIKVERSSENGQVTYTTVLNPLPPEEKHSLKEYDSVVEYYVGGDLQQHVVVSGFAFAAAMGALGLSIRRLTTSRAAADDEALVLAARAATVGADSPRRVTDDLSLIRSFNPETSLEDDAGDAGAARVPSGRWWLLAALLLLTTAALGYWVMAEKDVFNSAGWESFRSNLKAKGDAFAVTRHLAHAVLGGALVLVALIFAALAAWAPRRPLLLTFFATLMVLLIAAQVWIGIALSFNGEGPLTHFKEKKKKKSAEAALIHRDEVRSGAWDCVFADAT